MTFLGPIYLQLLYSLDDIIVRSSSSDNLLGFGGYVYLRMSPWSSMWMTSFLVIYIYICGHDYLHLLLGQWLTTGCARQ